MTSVNRRGRIPREKALEHERRAWELRQRMWTHERIAEELGLDRSSVSKILKRAQKRIGKEFDARLVNHRQEQIRQLMFIADEAMRAWEKSKEETRTVSRRKMSSSGSTEGPEEVTVKSQEMDGDPRFLNISMQALADLRKLTELGKEEEKRSEGQVSIGKMSNEDIASRIENILELGKARRDNKDEINTVESMMDKLDKIKKGAKDEAEYVQ